MDLLGNKFYKLFKHSLTASYRSSALMNTKIKEDSDPVVKMRRKDPFSSLYVSPKYARQMFKVIEPNIDLNVLVDKARIDLLEKSLSAREINLKSSVSMDEELMGSNGSIINQLVVDIKKLIEERQQLAPLSDKYSQLDEEFKYKSKKGIKITQDEIESMESAKINALKQREIVFDLEDILFPVILNLPNLIREDVPVGEEIHVIDSFEPAKKNQDFKILDHVKLGYINDAIYSSIIGPHSNFLIGDGAQLHYSLMVFFSKNLRLNGYHDLTGLDFVKSAIVEGCNAKQERNFNEDPMRISRGYAGKSFAQQMHLVGDSSLESMVASLNKRLLSRDKLPLRFFSIGTDFNCYNAEVSSANVIRCLSFTSDNVSIANDEMDLVYNHHWNAYKELQLPLRSVKVSAQDLKASEYSAYEIELWSPAKKSWISSSRISHYSDYLSRRLAFKDVQIIDSCLLNSHTLVAAIVECNQTEKGSFDIPQALKLYLL